MSWLEGQPILPRALDPAVAEMALHLGRHPRQPRPPKAVAWAERIQDSELRRETIIPIARLWKTRNPTAMQAWLEASDLPRELKYEILNPPPRQKVAIRPKPVEQERPEGEAELQRRRP